MFIGSLNLGNMDRKYCHLYTIIDKYKVMTIRLHIIWCNAIKSLDTCR